MLLTCKSGGANFADWRDWLHRLAHDIAAFGDGRGFSRVQLQCAGAMLQQGECFRFGGGANVRLKNDIGVFE